MKPHIKVMQRNGVDIFVTSSMTYKYAKPRVKRLRESSGSLESHVANRIVSQQAAQLRYESLAIHADYGHNHPIYQGINNPPTNPDGCLGIYGKNQSVTYK